MTRNGIRVDALVTSPTFLPVADVRRPRLGRAIRGRGSSRGPRARRDGCRGGPTTPTSVVAGAEIYLLPVVLGGGVPFSPAGSLRVDLDPIGSDRSGVATILRFRVRK